MSFGAAAYSAYEGGTAKVTVRLSAEPGEQVTIPLTTTNQGGASDDDYTLSVSEVVFASGDTEQSFTFTAAADTVEDGGESVTLGFGTLPAGVTAGTPSTAAVSIIDDPAVTVSFAVTAYSVDEGGTAEVKVTLSADPERTVTIPITATVAGGASGDDYSGVPDSVVFESGVTEQSFTVTATDDTVDDDGESVILGFGTLPAGVTAGTPDTTTVSIADDEVPANWDLIPTGLGAGDEFRLLFVTSNKYTPIDYSPLADIARYNGFVQEAAGGGHPDIQSSSSGFRTLISTRDVDARDNTATTPTTDDRGVPIYWVDGPRAAADYADFYDGAWGHRDPGRNEHGALVDFGSSDRIFTGSESDGTAHPESYLGISSLQAGSTRLRGRA